MICDVAKNQGKIDWAKLAPALDFVIIKASGKEPDPFYPENVAGAVRYNVPFHVYHFLYCTTETAAKKEAARFFNTVHGQGHMPMFWVLDCEKAWGVKDANAPGIVDTFVTELRRLAGDIRVAIYIAQEKYYDWKIDYSSFAYVWIPGYGEKWKPTMPCDMWQYTDKGTAPGISGNVDLDVLMGDKPMSFFTETSSGAVAPPSPTGEGKGENDKESGGGSMATDYKKYILSNGTHYISNSGSDENGGIKGGKAGDQNGKEWRLRSWYDRPWTCVLRWPNMDVGTLIAQLGIDAALNDNVGYDQGQRYTYQKELAKVGYFPAKIKTPCEDDCTAGVNANVHAAGNLLDIPALKNIPETGIRSGNMRKYYKAAGFKVLTDSKYLTSGKYLLPGDILLYDGHHGATNVTCGKQVRGNYTYHDVIANPGAYRPGPTPTPKPTKLGDRVLKYGDEGEDVKELQEDLIKLGYDLPAYGADGDFGGETERAVKRFQQEHQLPEDGVMDDEDYTALFQALDGEKWVEITGGRVNVRSAPGTDSRDIGTVHKGDRLPYQGQTKNVDGRDWYLIEYQNENGWVSSKYAKLVT